MSLFRSSVTWAGPVCEGCHLPIRSGESAFEFEDSGGTTYHIHKSCSEKFLQEIANDGRHMIEGSQHEAPILDVDPVNRG